MLTVGVLQILLQELGDTRGIAYLREVGIRQGTFTDKGDAVNGYAINHNAPYRILAMGLRSRS
jgi:hypothetical protein